MRATDTVYSLPDLIFRGGASEQFVFNLMSYGSDEPFDITGGSVIFSANDYVNPSANPVLEYAATLVKDATGGSTKAKVTIAPEDTKNLRGKYIYQLTAKDSGGNIDTNLAGLMVILENINPNPEAV